MMIEFEFQIHCYIVQTSLAFCWYSVQHGICVNIRLNPIAPKFPATRLKTPMLKGVTVAGNKNEEEINQLQMNQHFHHLVVQ